MYTFSLEQSPYIIKRVNKQIVGVTTLMQLQGLEYYAYLCYAAMLLKFTYYAQNYDQE